jgi:hypothetical protein
VCGTKANQTLLAVADRINDCVEFSVYETERANARLAIVEPIIDYLQLRFIKALEIGEIQVVLD